MITIYTYRINNETGEAEYKAYRATTGVNIAMAEIRHDKENNDMTKYGPITIYNVFDDSEEN